MNTYHADRKEFFSQLLKSLFFFLRHFWFLTTSVLLKFENRLRITILTSHQGTKRWPAVLGKTRRISCHSIDIQEFSKRLPKYQIADCNLISPNSHRIYNSSVVEKDKEDIFAGHRWGFLLNYSNQLAYEPEKKLLAIKSWISAHQDKNDVAWETYSSCERVANSLVFLSTLPEQDILDRTPSNYLEFLKVSIEWIFAHLEYYGERRTNNHILNNARALVMGGVALGDAQTTKAGMTLFHEFLPLLVSQEGLLRERSSHYQLIVLNWVMDAWKFIESQESDAKSEAQFLKGYALGMLSASSIFTANDGELCSTIGDVSPDFSPIQSSLRITLLYADCRLNAEQCLNPQEIRDDWFRLRVSDDIVLGNFVVKNFPLSYPTHGHNDFTGFVWNSGQDRILIDPGRFRYTNDTMSLFQKSAAAHNVPVINGFPPFCESLIPNGEWWPLPYANVSANMHIKDESVILVHNGFSRATPVKCHTRQIKLMGKSLEVVDEFDGEGRVEVVFCWHFSGSFNNFDEHHVAMMGSKSMVGIDLIDQKLQTPINRVVYEFVKLNESNSYGDIAGSSGLRIKILLDLPSKTMTRFSIKQCAV